VGVELFYLLNLKATINSQLNKLSEVSMGTVNVKILSRDVGLFSSSIKLEFSNEKDPTEMQVFNIKTSQFLYPSGSIMRVHYSLGRGGLASTLRLLHFPDSSFSMTSDVFINRKVVTHVHMKRTNLTLFGHKQDLGKFNLTYTSSKNNSKYTFLMGGASIRYGNLLMGASRIKGKGGYADGKYESTVHVVAPSLNKTVLDKMDIVANSSKHDYALGVSLYSDKTSFIEGVLANSKKSGPKHIINIQVTDSFINGFLDKVGKMPSASTYSLLDNLNKSGHAHYIDGRWVIEYTISPSEYNKFIK
jgi:hypothetical protein